MKQKKEKQEGFTLVELAIVMLIIGLIIGGVFRAVEVIDNVEVKRVGQALTDFKVAFYSYYDRTGKYPGANVNSPEILMDIATVDDGHFFQDLFDEGFIATPTPAYDFVSPGHFYATYLPASAGVSAENGTIVGKNQVCVSQLDSTSAQHLDLLFDNGDWNSGNLRADTEYGKNLTNTLCLEF